MQGGLQQEFLRRTSRIAKLFKKTAGPIGNAIAASPPPLPQLNFILPDHVKSELDDSSIPAEMRNALTTAIHDLQEDYHRVYKRAYTASLSSPLPQFSAIHKLGAILETRFLNQSLPGLMDHYMAEKSGLQLNTSQEESRRKFNNAYIPYLKAYFDYNAYPSLHDREVMAQKSMMTSRQIEVWFQNHRRVEKKAGRPCVKRKASDAGPSQSQIDKIEQAMGVFGVSKEKREGTETEEEKWDYIRKEKGRGFPSLSAPRYPHDATAIDVLAMPDRPIPAFVPGYTPFLTSTAPVVNFPPPMWTRRPATQPLPHHDHAQHLSFSELSEAFATTLRVYSDIPRVSDESVPPAATCAITTRLEPGYHPALMNTPAVRRMEAMRRKEAMLPRRSRPTRSPSPELQRQVSWSSASSGSEESLPATPQSAHVELEPEPFDDLFDEVPVHEVPLDIQGFVYADYPATVVAVGGKKKKSHYRT